MRKVLMVAYHFPPLAGSSGIQRTLRFAQQLPEFGWQPIVLTTHPRAYERTSDDLLREVPTDLPVARVFALDTARHLSVAGRYPHFLARPDRWMTWRFAAVGAGLALVRQHGLHAVWSTFPIATAHQIGGTLARRTRLPWIADSPGSDGTGRLPRGSGHMEKLQGHRGENDCRGALECFYDAGSGTRIPAALSSRRRSDRGGRERIRRGKLFGVRCGRRARAAAPGCHHAVAQRDGLSVGARSNASSSWRSQRSSTLAMFATASSSCDFAPPVTTSGSAALATEFGIERFIELLPPIPYRAALEEMLRADALLVLQAANCNEQIPAKLYEYLRSGRPIVAADRPRRPTRPVSPAPPVSPRSRRSIPLPTSRRCSCASLQRCAQARPRYRRLTMSPPHRVAAARANWRRCSIGRRPLLRPQIAPA
jgi:hypothetical protein